MRWSRSPLLLAVWASLSLVGCGGGGIWQEELSRLPSRAVEHMDEAGREHIEAQRTLVERLAREGVVAAELAAEIGQLGRLYNAYRLTGAAEACYLVAEDLEPGDFRWPHLRGFLLQDRGDVEAAALAYERALDNAPERVATLYRLAETELSLDRPERARELFERCLALQPGFAGGHFGLGRTALSVENYRAAVEHLEEALEIEPSATKIHHPLGLAYRGLGDLDRAAAHLQRPGSVDVRLVDPVVAELSFLGKGSHSRLRRGLSALASGSIELAVREFEAALEDDPDYAEVRHNLAVALSRAGRLEEAIQSYRELIARVPDDASARLALGNLLATLDRMEEAIVEFQEAVALAPDFKNARFNLGAALESQGRWNEALAQYDEVIALDPDFASVRYQWAMAKAKTGDPQSAQRAFQQQIERDPWDVQARIALAQILRRRQEASEARSVLREGLAVPGLSSPAAARLHLETAIILAARNRLEKALEELDTARGLDPFLLETSLVRGQVLLRTDRYREAVLEFGRVLGQRPGYVPARLGWAEALSQSGDCAGARRLLEEGRRVQPADQNLAQALEQVRAGCAG